MRAPPASTAETTGATPRSAAAAPTASAASFAPSCVSAGTSAVENSAAAPAIDADSSSSGVSPLVPIAPTTSPPAFSGMPPVRQEAPWSDELPPGVDDRHDNAEPLLARGCLGCGEDGLGAGLVDDTAHTNRLHG